MINDDFYLRFEDEFRGPRPEIKQRVSAYLPIIEPLKVIYPNGVIVDLGCGRGEWIELLQENGWCVQGVDINMSMVEMCQSLGLPALQVDAIEYLRSLEENSVSVVSGFHIAEHLPFELLLELVREAHRTLLPGGMLILETPNPENDIVRASSFYLDPTHRNPLPPVLMQFIAKDCGFSKSVIMRLNGPKAPKNKAPISRYVLWALSANPDYGLVAQKWPDPQMANFDALDRSGSELVDGLTILNNSIVRFENELDAIKNELNQKTSELQAALNAKETERQGLQAALNAKEAERQGLQAALNAKETERQGVQAALNAKETERQGLQAALNGVYAGHSWRITLPLRKTAYLIRSSAGFPARITRGIAKRTKAMLKKIIVRMMPEVISHPSLNGRAMGFLNRHPNLRIRLKGLAIASGIVQSAPTTIHAPTLTMADGPQNLSLRAQQIYIDLLAAIKQNRGGR